MVVLVLPERVEDEVKFRVVLLPKGGNLSLEISVLELMDLQMTPAHREVAQVDNGPEWVPE